MTHYLIIRKSKSTNNQPGPFCPYHRQLSHRLSVCFLSFFSSDFSVSLPYSFQAAIYLILHTMTDTTSNQNQPGPGTQSGTQTRPRGRGRGPGRDRSRGSGRGGRRGDGRGRLPARGSDRGGFNNHSAAAAAAPADAPAREALEWRRGGRARNRRGARGSAEGPSAGFWTGRAFGAGLTTNFGATAAEFVPGASGHEISGAAGPELSRAAYPGGQRPKAKAAASTAPDLPTRIHEDIANLLYECAICTGEIGDRDKVWTCSICWIVLHNACVGEWHKTKMLENIAKQMTDVPSIEWNCPGCNMALTDEPGVYRCWCGKEENPEHVAGLPPHSCGQTCSKQRATCPHKCTLQCHAGPCPPCQLMDVPQPCFCGRATKTRRCIELPLSNGWSCGEPCGDMMPCGEHECPQPCHAGLCGCCSVAVTVRCYCGKVERQMRCHQRGEPKESSSLPFHHHGRAAGDESSSSTFTGWFRCGDECQRFFDCGHHKCLQGCHPQDEKSAHCPLSPDVLLRCPCSKTLISDLVDSPRQACTDPIPSCAQTCDKVLACGHKCPNKCHSGECQPCVEIVQVSCRCGRPFGQETCADVGPELPVCDRTCQAQM